MTTDRPAIGGHPTAGNRRPPLDSTSVPSATTNLDGQMHARSAARSSGRVGPSIVYGPIKRLTDLLLASVFLVVTLPLFLVVAVVIKSSSRGPVFYTHERIGQRGEPFTLIKFRTMRPGAAADVAADPALYDAYVANDFKLAEDDARITRVGRWLRKSSLDELPQLLNVLSGQMSIVGIRPLIDAEFAERSLEDRELYASLRPGLTGLWQVAGRSTVGRVERRALDRRYGLECSAWLDLSILMRTPGALLRTEQTR